MTAVLSQPDVIFDSAWLQVLHSRGEGDLVFVTFSEYFMRADGRQFWADSLLSGDRVPAFGVVAKAANWFPVAAMQDAATAIREVASRCGYRRLVTYGHSMGGYAAIKHAKALGADVVIASCPQSSINPDDVGSFDRRFESGFVPSLHRDMRIATADVQGRVYILFDPRSIQDRRHVEMIEDAAPVDRIAVPSSGHETINVLTQTSISREIVYGLAAEQPIGVARVTQIIRGARRRSLSYWKARAATLAMRKPQLRRERQHALHQALALRSDEVFVFMMLAHFAHEGGDRDAAEAWLASACQVAMAWPHSLIETLWRFCQELGQRRLGSELVSRYLSEAPSDPDRRNLHTRDMLETGRLREIVADLDRLEGVSEGKPDLLRTVLGARLTLGQFDAALRLGVQSLRLGRSRTLPDDGSPLTIDLRHGGDAADCLQCGWSFPEVHGTWSVGEHSVFGLNLGGSARIVRLTIVGAAFLHPAGPPRQRLIVHVSERIVGSFALDTTDMRAMDVLIPSDLSLGDALLVRLHHPDARRPSDLGQSLESRELAVAIRSVTFSC